MLIFAAVCLTLKALTEDPKPIDTPERRTQLKEMRECMTEHHEWSEKSKLVMLNKDKENQLTLF